MCVGGYIYANSCDKKLALTSAGYISTAVNLSCHGNLGTSSGHWGKQIKRGAVGGETLQAR